MSDLSNQPVGLPAGSFELGALRQAYATIATEGAKPDVDRDALAAAELDAINERVRPEKGADGAILPGHMVVEQERVLDEGTEVSRPGKTARSKPVTETIGRIAVTETIEVFDSRQAEEETEAADEAAPGIEAIPDALMHSPDAGTIAAEDRG